MQKSKFLFFSALCIKPLFLFSGGPAPPELFGQQKIQFFCDVNNKLLRFVSLAGTGSAWVWSYLTHHRWPALKASRRSLAALLFAVSLAMYSNIHFNAPRDTNIMDILSILSLTFHASLAFFIVIIAVIIFFYGNIRFLSLLPSLPREMLESATRYYREVSAGEKEA